MVPGAPDSQNWPDRTVAGVSLLSPPSLPARRQSPLSCLRSWRPILASPPAPLTRGRGAAPTPRARCRLPCDARPGVSSPGELARWPCARRAPEPGAAGPVRLARPGCRPPPRPAPAAGLCPGLRKGAPPALGTHQQTVMELVAGRLRPALARPSRPPGAPQALLGPSLPACAPSCPPLLSPAQGPCPQTRR